MSAPPQPIPMPDVSLLYGPPLIGLMIASFMSGFITLQSIMYYRNYPNDTWMRYFVGGLWTIDMVHLGVITHFVFWYAITNWGHVEVLPELPWSFGTEIILNCWTTSLCQFFLIFRVKVLSNNNWWLVAFLCLLASLQTGVGTFLGIRSLLPDGNIALLGRFKDLASVWFFSGAIGESIIATLLVYFLRSKRSVVSGGYLDTLIMYTVSTGILTSAVAYADIACFLAMPANFVHLAFNFAHGKIYSNALLASLNGRTAHRDRDYTVTKSTLSHIHSEAPPLPTSVRITRTTYTDNADNDSLGKTQESKLHNTHELDYYPPNRSRSSINPSPRPSLNV